ncbi:MAG: ROK family protein [Lachnospiraceae bacterium]|nr:ROK family protein [Lachnospiraceae bacterium]
MQKYIVGVDIGGTTIKLAIFPVGERATETWEIKTTDREHILEIWKDIADAIRAKFAELGYDMTQLAAVGMDLPGPICDNGYLPWCVNLGMGACYPAKELSDVLGGVPVAACNDANAAALGEVYYGAAKGADNAALFTLGTGVGGGIIVGGRIVAGNRGIGGEVGHFVVNPDETEKCNCGNRGCLEQYCSATGMVRMAKKLLAKGELKSKLYDLPEDAITAKDICDVAKEGDELGLEVIDIYSKYLAIAASHITLTVDPDVIIIGGGVSKAGAILIDKVAEYVAEYTHIAEKKPAIVLAELGNDAGTYGSAALASQLL